MTLLYYLITLATFGMPKDSTVLTYDGSVLRLPGADLPIGILTISPDGTQTKTLGYLGGDELWSDFDVKVQGARFTLGHILFPHSSRDKKGDSITVSVYRQRGLLLTQKIPYDYVDSIRVRTRRPVIKAPGGDVPFYIRIWYDHKIFMNVSMDRHHQIPGIKLAFSGGHLNTTPGRLEIDPNTRDKAGIVAILTSNPSIRDSLTIPLDYRKDYVCDIPSSRDGHNLDLRVDMANDSLLSVDVLDETSKKNYPYLVNIRGSSLEVTTRAANGQGGSIQVSYTVGALPYLHLLRLQSLADDDVKPGKITYQRLGNP
jgi:hypothetical protein